MPCTWGPSDLTYRFLSTVVLRRPSRSCNSPHSTHHTIVHSVHHAILQVPWKQLFLATDPGIPLTQLFGTPNGPLFQNLQYADDVLCCLLVGLHLHIHFTVHTFHCYHNGWKILKQMHFVVNVVDRNIFIRYEMTQFKATYNYKQHNLAVRYHANYNIWCFHGEDKTLCSVLQYHAMCSVGVNISEKHAAYSLLWKWANFYPTEPQTAQCCNTEDHSTYILHTMLQTYIHQMIIKPHHKWTATDDHSI